MYKTVCKQLESLFVSHLVLRAVKIPFAVELSMKKVVYFRGPVTLFGLRLIMIPHIQCMEVIINCFDEENIFCNQQYIT